MLITDVTLQGNYTGYIETASNPGITRKILVRKRNKRRCMGLGTAQGATPSAAIKGESYDNFQF